MANEGTRPLGEGAQRLGGHRSSCSAPRSIPRAPADAIALRAYRRNRVRTALASHDLAAIVLFNPINIRYACDARNMQVYGLHNPCRYVCMTADGHTTLFEFRNCEHLSRHLETVDEIRPAKAWYHMAAGPNALAAASAFAREIAALVHERCGGGNRIAFDRLDPAGAAALAAEGLAPVDGLALLDFARAIKSADEIKAMCDAIRACEEGLRRMQAAHRPGITEQALWSVLCQANAELGGEWMETRLLSAGARTNPWYNECGDYVIAAGRPRELRHRSRRPARLFRRSLALLAHRRRARHRRAAAALRARPRADPSQHRDSEARPHVPRDRRRRVPAARGFVPRMNRAIAHGIGLCNEYPLIVNREYIDGAYDGVLAEGMVLCVESYVGEPGGRDGVKLEEQVLITGERRGQAFRVSVRRRACCDTGWPPSSARRSATIFSTSAPHSRSASSGGTAAADRGVQRRRRGAEARGLAQVHRLRGDQHLQRDEPLQCGHLVGELRVDERRLRAVVLDRLADGELIEARRVGVTANFAVQRDGRFLHRHESGRRVRRSATGSAAVA